VKKHSKRYFCTYAANRCTQKLRFFRIGKIADEHVAIGVKRALVFSRE
jgi:hypothetical protein